ncbi:MAG: polysaccharide deacetylase family protein [Dehalococcoidia bacterium]
MYHDVVRGSPLRGGGPERFTVSRAAFEAMLDAIAQAGYVGCSIETALRRSGDRCVGVTFDDGTAGQYEEAVPALQARGMTATFFVTTDWVGTPGFMSWDQLRELTRAGMSIQSHTKSHPHLSELEHDGLLTELRESKTRLDDELGQDTTQLALPGGDAPKRAFRHALTEAGYGVIATSRWGRNSAAATGPGELRWLRRCNIPRDITDSLARRILSADPRLTVSQYSREAVLNGLRNLLGASRYARWRRRVLDALG